MNGGSLSATTSFTLAANRGMALGPTGTTAGTGTIDVASDVILTYDGVVADNGTDNGSLVKAGPGKLVLGGTSTYHGTTTINGGTFAGHATLSNSTVLPGSAGHTIWPSAFSSSSSGTLTVGGLTTSSNSTLRFNLLSSGASDLITVLGTLDVSNSGTLKAYDAGVPEGYYHILQVGTSGTMTGDVRTLTMNQGSLPASIAYIIDTHHSGVANWVDIHKVLIGDADASGVVDGGDFDIWFTHLQASTFLYELGDFNGDGLVDGADFDIWFTHLQNTWGSGGTSTMMASGGSNRFLTDEQIEQMDPFLSDEQREQLAIWIAEWNGGGDSFASTMFVGGVEVPEPASLGVLMLGSVSLLLRRRRPCG